MAAWAGIEAHSEVISFSRSIFCAKRPAATQPMR
jgi:hypothetical protein